MAAPLDRETSSRRLTVIAGLLVGSTVTWRTSSFYSGGLDPVVAAKGLMNVAAMVLAIGAARRAPVRQVLNTRTTVVLGLILLSGLFGAWYSGALFSSGVLSVRIVILAVIVSQLLRAYEIERVLRAMAIWIIAIVLVAVATGFGTTSVGHLAGRLQGGIPPLQPNEITLLCGIVVLGLCAGLMKRKARLSDIVLLMMLSAFIWLTGSRTGLVALVIAVIVMLMQVHRPPIALVLGYVFAVPVLIYALFGTTMLTGFLNRGGESNILTLSDRTVAWTSALHLHTAFWDTWFGSGLSLVQVPVNEKYRSVQLLDSSWVSALVQSGIVGFGLFALWVLMGISAAAHAPRAQRPLMTGLIAFIIFRTFTESGLVGATPAFVVFLIVALNPRPPAVQTGNTVSSPAVRIPSVVK